MRNSGIANARRSIKKSHQLKISELPTIKESHLVVRHRSFASSPPKSHA
jgi:hypothetical protein